LGEVTEEVEAFASDFQEALVVGFRFGRRAIRCFWVEEGERNAGPGAADDGAIGIGVVAGEEGDIIFLRVTGLIVYFGEEFEDWPVFGILEEVDGVIAAGHIDNGETDFAESPDGSFIAGGGFGAP
jgi:hypothetical protein